MAGHLSIDRDRCMGSGQCTFYAPDTFDLDESSIAVVTDPHGDSDDKIEMAITTCPTRSITRDAGNVGDGGAPMTAKAEAAVSAPIADLDSDSLLGTFPEGQRLVGTRCDQCGRTMIGARVVCSSCVSREVSPVALPATGTLYSFTRLHGISSKHSGSEGVRPIGYVDLDGGVRTLADLREGATALRPDMRVELGVEGDEWFFVPAGE